MIGMSSYISPVMQFILDGLHSDQDLVTLTDNQFHSGLLREPVALSPPMYTRVGIEYSSDNRQGHFFSQIRDFTEQKIQVKITIVTSYGQNDNHCRSIVDTITTLFLENRKETTDDYKIYIDSIDSSIVETDQSRWIGTINMAVTYLVAMPDIE